MKTGRKMAAGIYENISNETYHTWEGVSSSQLKALRRSVFDLQKAWVGKVDEESDALLFGSLVHDMVLLPGRVDRAYLVAPESFKSTGTKKLADWAAGAKKEKPLAKVVTHSQFEEAKAILAAIQKHPKARALLLDNGGKNELSVVAEDPRTGLKLRARFDRIRQSVVVDLKTCRDASPKGFKKAAMYDYSYDLQAVHYLYTAYLAFGGAREFVFVAVEKGSCEIGLYKFPTAYLNQVDKEYQKLLDEYKRALDLPPLPGYTDGVEDLDVPTRGGGLKIGGKEV